MLTIFVTLYAVSVTGCRHGFTHKAETLAMSHTHPKEAMKSFFFLYISLTVVTCRLIEAQMDLPRLLFGVGFQIFIVTPQMFRFSRE